MEAVGGWERNKERTRIALAAAAVRLFRQNGYENTTVDEIARAAGSSRRTFFRYFGTKEEVLFLDIRAILDELRVSLDKPLPGESRWTQVREAITASVERMAEPGDEIERVSIASWLGEPAISRRFGEYSAELEELVGGALADERGVDLRVDLRARLTAKAVTAAYMSAFSIYLETDRELPAVLDQAFDLVEEGLPDARP